MAEREALQARLQKIDTAIADYQRWVSSVADLVGADKVPASGERFNVTATEQQATISEFEDAVIALFDTAQKPLKRTEVFEELTKAGLVVGGKDPLNTVASRLSRMQGITNVRGHGYWAAHRPYLPAGHEGERGDPSGGTETADQGQASGLFPVSVDTTGVNS
ncbi:hypothetical protein DKT77_12640 [Meridianimarinicoccus roseus]|uniref:Uncharacterized protein n=2 Tax=Meridianimarinicoccus roseus TaxID=2072018 RepID=A0A2V2LAI7_9RHOB|nr:hypothetical protein DKT77_12640 [Meridianimarinicoccus roseus]